MSNRILAAAVVAALIQLPTSNLCKGQAPIDKQVFASFSEMAAYARLPWGNGVSRYDLTGNSFCTAVGMGYRIFSKPTFSIDAIADVGYSTWQLNGNQPTDSEWPKPEPVPGEVDTVQRVEATLDALGSDATWSIGVRFNVAGFGVDVSHVWAYVTSDETTQSLTLTNPPGSKFDTTLFEPGTVTYANDGRSIVTGHVKDSSVGEIKTGFQGRLFYTATEDNISVRIGGTLRTMSNAGWLDAGIDVVYYGLEVSASWWF